MAVPVFGSVATLIAILIFWGSIGKSAQFPLHVWLPDAMEGPTPVSALIHAATMVSAGVYLIIRMYPLMLAGCDCLRSTLHRRDRRLHRLLCRQSSPWRRPTSNGCWPISTISQLGYMFAALGVGAYVAAVFHLITHAFFKALLFLGSGSVIHGMEHGEHHAHEHGHARSTGLRRQRHALHGRPAQDRCRGTFIAFLIGGLALAGFPIITAGFWSKDEILAETWHKLIGTCAGPGPMALFAFIASGMRGLPDGLLHLASDQHDLPGQAAYRVRQRMLPRAARAWSCRC